MWWEAFLGFIGWTNSPSPPSKKTIDFWNDPVRIRRVWEDQCCDCGKELDGSYKCSRCGFDSYPEVKSETGC